MELIADGLLIATALTAGLYCLVLSRRLRKLTDAESGIGTQISALSKALDETRAGLAETRRGVAEARASLRNARDDLAGGVEAARREAAALAEARGAALLALSRLETGIAGEPRSRSADAVPPPGETSAPRAGPLPDWPGAGRTPPAAADEDEIPDWPDGVVPLPGEMPAAEAMGQAATPRAPAGPAPLRVERMAL
jgi:hypothetical protein